MQILANALPGFRDLRGPVISGYMWLLFGWLIVRPDLHRRPTAHFAAAVYDLGHDVGRVPIAIAVSVAAYLIGAASREVVEIPARVVRQTRASLGKTAHISLGRPSFAVANAGYEEEDPTSAAVRFDSEDASQPRTPLGLAEQIDEIAEQANSAVQEQAVLFFEWLEHAERDRFVPDELRSEANRRVHDMVSVRRDRAVRDLDRELDVPATLLLADQPEVFAEVDRLRAEAELRFAIVAPLIALALLLTTANPLWCAMLIGAAVLVVQGVRQRREGRAIVEEAIRIGRIESKSIASFATWARSARQEATEEFGRLIERKPFRSTLLDMWKRDRPLATDQRSDRSTLE